METTDHNTKPLLFFGYRKKLTTPEGLREKFIDDSVKLYQEFLKSWDKNEQDYKEKKIGEKEYQENKDYIAKTYEKSQTKRYETFLDKLIQPLSTEETIIGIIAQKLNITIAVTKVAKEDIDPPLVGVDKTAAGGAGREGFDVADKLAEERPHIRTSAKPTKEVASSRVSSKIIRAGTKLSRKERDEALEHTSQSALRSR